MKKYFLIICIAFIPVSIQAQWSLGGKAGINWSTINYPWSKLGDHADYLSGFQGGIIATYQFNNYFDMQAELFYSARGYTDDEFTLPMKAELSSAIPTHVEPTIWIFPY